MGDAAGAFYEQQANATRQVVAAMAGGITQVPREMLVRNAQVVGGPQGGAPNAAAAATEMKRDGGAGAWVRPPSSGAVVLSQASLEAYLSQGGDPNAVPKATGTFSSICWPSYKNTALGMCMGEVCSCLCIPMCCYACCAVSCANGNAEGNTLLHFSVMYAQPRATLALLKAGASPFIVNERGETPMAFGIRHALAVQTVPEYATRVAEVQRVLDEAVRPQVDAWLAAHGKRP